MTTFLNYVTQYTKPFNDISSVLSELQSALACADRLYMILDEEEITETGKVVLEEADVQDVFNLIMSNLAICLINLLSGFALKYPCNQKYCCHCSLRAGKSTLINLLMRFYDLDKGNILLDGRPITDYTVRVFGTDWDGFARNLAEVALIHDNIAYGNPEAVVKKSAAAATLMRFLCIPTSSCPGATLIT